MSTISLRNVHKSYQLGEARVHALRGLSLDINRGEFTALIGPSGSGKSTLLNMVGCLDQPDSGSVLFDGDDVARLDENRRSELRSRKVGFIFQTFNLIPVLSVYENIELPMMVRPEISPKERKERALQAIEDVNLGRFLRHLPDKLSGGQRQRVAIARALVNQPSLILADEPTASLDADTAHRIIDLMLDLNKRRGVTFFFSTHDEKLMDRVERILRIRDGVIAQ